MKYVFYIFLIGLVIFIIIGAFSYFFIKNQDPPSIKDAPYAFQTYSQDGVMVASRIYYAAEVAIINNKPVIKEYWTLDGKTYKKHGGEKELPENTRIIRR